MQTIRKFLAAGVFQIRTRLVLVVVLAVIPALFLTLYIGVKQKQQAVEQANRELRNVTKMVASEQELVLNGAKQLLGVLAHLPEVRSLEPELCDPLLASLLKSNPLYANFGVADREGTLLCSALPFVHPINYADRMWFKRAVDTRTFAVGDYAVSRTAHSPALSCACPFFDDDGNILGIAFATLDLKWESQLLAAAHLPEGTVATLLDSSGNILARSDDSGKWVGKSVADIPFIQAVLACRKEGAAESAGVDGVTRLYTFRPLKESSGSIVGYLILGIPPDVAYAASSRMMIRSLLFLGAVGAFAVVAAWVFAGAFVLRRTKGLVAAANRLRAGDLTSRTRPDHQFGEFTDLARAFDEMADALERRIAELNHAHAELFLDESRLETLLKLNAMSEAPWQEIADFALEGAVRLTRSEIGYLALMNEDETVMTMHSWSGSAKTECAPTGTPAYPIVNAGLWGEAVRQRKGVITNNCPAPDPLTTANPAGRDHVTCHMDTPVFDGDRIVIVAGVCNKETPYGESDVRQLTLLMQGLWGMIQHQRAERELEQHRDQLEQLVATRTAELKEINDELSADIIERKLAEEALRKALANLQKSHEELKASQMLLINAEKLEITGRLAAGVAHEVKNPLAILAMSLDYLTGVLPDREGNVADVLKDMRDAIMRADRIIRGLLDFSASEKLELEPADLNSVIEKAILLVRHSRKSNSVELVKNLAHDLPRVAIDQNKAVQALVNIFSNSIDAMPEGGTLTVRSYSKQPTNTKSEEGSHTSGFRWEATIVVVEIKDTGSGIPPDKVAKIFDPFFTTKSTGKGTGLGLTVTRKIIELHGGSLQITNRPEGGVRALLLFPVLRTQ